MLQGDRAELVADREKALAQLKKCDERIELCDEAIGKQNERRKEFEKSVADIHESIGLLEKTLEPVRLERDKQKLLAEASEAR